MQPYARVKVFTADTVRMDCVTTSHMGLPFSVPMSSEPLDLSATSSVAGCTPASSRYPEQAHVQQSCERTLPVQYAAGHAHKCARAACPEQSELLQPDNGIWGWLCVCIRQRACKPYCKGIHDKFKSPDYLYTRRQKVPSNTRCHRQSHCPQRVFGTYLKQTRS